MRRALAALRNKSAAARERAWMTLLLGGDLGAIDDALKPAMCPVKARPARARRRTPTLPDDRESILAAADGFLLAMAKRRMSILQDEGVPPLWKAQSARYKRIKPPHARANRVVVGAAGQGVCAATVAAAGAAAATLGDTIARFLGRD